MPDIDILEDSFVITLPAIIKANPTQDGRRVFSVEASNENVDSEGDCIAQSALLNAAPGFIARGVIDQDHLSEIGARYGIPNPAEFIVGVPLEVTDGGKGRTLVKGELHQPRPGVVSKADIIWNGITANPPVKWRASIYGFPTGSGSFVDARVQKCPDYPNAKRYVVKAMSWRSLALTVSPINDSLSEYAHVVTMKAHIEHLRSISMLPAERQVVIDNVAVKGDVALPGFTEALFPPRNRVEMLGHYTHHIDKGKCPFSGNEAPLGRSVAAFRNHFTGCCGVDEGLADMLALAMMQALKHERK